MLLCDGGTSYSKIYDTETRKLSIIPTKELIKDTNRFFYYATGHSSRSLSVSYFNELITMALGALELIPHEDFTILDIGSRDMKYVIFRQRQPVNMDWNSSCGSNMGFTVEVLGKYYDIDFDNLDSTKDSVPVTCGLLGIEKVFDEINRGLPPEIGIGKFLRGIAKISHSFAQKPSHLYLSGGFTLNRCFVETLKDYCQVNLLGRDVLIHGLLRIMRQESDFKENTSLSPLSIPISDYSNL